MNQPKAECTWKIGDLVFNKIEAKEPKNLLRVVGITPDGEYLTRYHLPELGIEDYYTKSRRRAAKWQVIGSLLVDPAEYGIKVEDWRS